MRETFYTEGGQLFDPTGNKVILRGVNKMSVRDEDDPTGAAYFPEIRKTQANSVRIVWAITKDLDAAGAKTDLDTLDALITNARKNQLIPMIELHDARGRWERLQELVEYWVKPDVVTLIQKHQAYLLVNIGNEVGDDKVKPVQFIAGYKKAVESMRKAGIHTPLVIDASDWGKSLDILDASADKLIAADQDKNLIFSVHLYWPKSAGFDADIIQSKLQPPDVERNFPLLVGEFSRYDGYAGEDKDGKVRSICGEFGEIDYQTILKVTDEIGLGWYAWEWGPGNAKGTPPDPLCVVMDMTPDGKFEHLKDGWAKDVVDSIKTASEKPGYFSLPPIVELSPAVKTRIETLTAVLTNKTDKSAVSKALQQANGDWSMALASLTEKKFPKEALRTVALANSLADWTDDNVPLVTTLAKRNDLTNLRDVALNFNVKGLTTLVAPAAKLGTPAYDQAKASAIGLRQKLFATETTAVLQRMVQDAEIPIADAKVLTGITQFLNNQPDFNIRTTSIYTVLKDPNVFKDIAEEQQAGVIDHMKTLQRVQALTLVPETVPVLINANLTSAFQVGEMPESTFLRLHSEALGGEQIAKDIHYNAINNRIRNEQALITMQESVRGAGFAIMDDEPLQTRTAMMRNVAPASDVSSPDITPLTRLERMQAVVNDNKVPLNLEALFGSTDYCECNECQSVYSPASYFVELLQYLRNNNLGRDPNNPNNPSPGIRTNDPKNISGTPLEKLFLRRPDLGCLELTCENTFTVLPYIDLVNEVMESFVVHLGDYIKDPTIPKWTQLDAFNVEDETTSELLAQPQHTNYQAYCILKSAVYPFTLPYHQPIDAIRIFLNYLGTSRYELLDTYRTAHEACVNTTLTPAEQQEIQSLHDEVQKRAVDAEFLGLTQEEYIILTKEAFWRKRYFDINQKTTYTVEEYRQKIGVKPVHEYYGYDNEADMLNRDESKKLGLTFVKKQFLPRTGIQYTDLVELIKTRFINPNFPLGKALTILESIRFSYQFLLQTFVKPTDMDKPPTVRFAELIKFLEDPQAQALYPDLQSLLHPEADPCKKQHQHCPEINSKDLQNWVYCYFDRIGQLIVLESGEEPLLMVKISRGGTEIPLEGEVILKNNGDDTSIGSFRKNGMILDATGVTIAYVSPELKVTWLNGKPIQDNQFASIIKNAGAIGSISFYGKIESDLGTVSWIFPPDTCNLDKVRLIHLDGSPVTEPEYDGIHLFIRLWRKLGWTIDETDKALTGLLIDSVGNGAGGTSVGTGAGSEICEFVGFDVFVDTCPADGNIDEGCGPNIKPPVDGPIDKGDCPDPLPINTTVAPEFLHQLVAVKKLLDLTGLPLIRLLAFWADISTAGEKSLYSRLFLTHNLLGIDKVFKADANGNYLTESAKITDHLQVLMAALKLKADDITAIMGFVVPPLTDALTLPNVSVLYRYSLLAKVLHVQVADLPEVIALFSPVLGNPFRRAWNFLALIETWGKMEDAGFTFRQLDYITVSAYFFHVDKLSSLI